MNPQWVAAWAAVCAVVVAVLARWPGRSIWRLARFLWRLVQRTAQFLEDWNGEPGRPGVPERPGVMKRLETHDRILTDVAGIVGYQLKPNNGQSLVDKVNRIDDRTSQQQPAPAIHIHTDGKAD